MTAFIFGIAAGIVIDKTWTKYLRPWLIAGARWLGARIRK